MPLCVKSASGVYLYCDSSRSLTKFSGELAYSFILFCSKQFILVKGVSFFLWMFCSSKSYEVFHKIFVLGKGTSFKFDIISSLVSTFFFVLGEGTGFSLNSFDMVLRILFSLIYSY